MLAVQTITGPVAAVAGGFTLFRLVQLRPIYSGLSVRWTLFWWLLFQDLYGPVWAQRFMNRMAQFERAERWSCSLQRSGFVGLNEQPLQEVDLARPLESFRWVISRFAESEWLERHLPFVAAGTSSDSPDAPPC